MDLEDQEDREEEEHEIKTKVVVEEVNSHDNMETLIPSSNMTEQLEERERSQQQPWEAEDKATPTVVIQMEVKEPGQRATATTSPGPTWSQSRDAQPSQESMDMEETSMRRTTSTQAHML